MGRRLFSCALLLLFVLNSVEGRAKVVFQEPFDSDLPNFTDNSQWQGSYCLDKWRTDLNGGVIANRDHACTVCPCDFTVGGEGQDACLASDPFDNHIQAGNRYWRDYRLLVKLVNGDDDTMGVLFRYQNAGTFYLFALSRESIPSIATGCHEQFLGARLVRLQSGVAQVLKEVAGFTYTPGTAHQVRVTVQGKKLKVEFDLDGDGQFGPLELFYDQEDDGAQYIPAGQVGLFAYNNGVTEDDGTPAPCSGKGCWFDEVVVDLLPPDVSGCGGVPWEGQCQGNKLSYCDLTGKLQEQSCEGESCCGWLASEGYYTCLPKSVCQGACTDGCLAGEMGCSSNLTHSFLCGQGDGDGCLEPVFTACLGGIQCDPVAGKCDCTPACAGKQCGADGCGGSCGGCPTGQECQQGKCVTPPGELGDPCMAAAECAEPLCLSVPGVGYKICSVSCSTQQPCPAPYECQTVTVDGQPVQACLPHVECQPDCQGKECGSDGCEGSCGQCGADFTCKGGICAAGAGASCDSGFQCASGLCLSFPKGTYCTGPCSTDAGCPAGWHCTPWVSSEVPNICAPPAGIVVHKECAAVAACIEGCPSVATGCSSNCFFVGSTAAQADYSALAQCADALCVDSCGGNQPCLAGCILDLCFQEFAACFPGSVNCQSALDCALACDGLPGCVKGCYDEAFPAAKKILTALFVCLEEQCPSDSQPGCKAEALAGKCQALVEQCAAACEPQCGGALCGDDGCGGSCGTCPEGWTCKLGKCEEPCAGQCDGRECGDDGCGGSCGGCVAGLACVAGQCVDEAGCRPRSMRQCVGESLYWFDSCGRAGELVEECARGCEEGGCRGEEPGGEAVMMNAPRADGGCRIGGEGAGGGLVLLLLALLGLFAGRRPAHE